jgi:hypothetical protein
MTLQVKVDYDPRPKQALFHSSNATECLFGGAKSPGKSCALTMEAAAYGFQYPGSQPYLFRSTYDDLDANLIQEFLKRIPKEAYQYDGSKHEAHLNNGSTVKFRYIQNLTDAYKYNGRSIPWIGVDELTEHCEQAMQILLSCNRTADRFPVRFRATANPGNRGHKWVCKRYVHGTKYGKEKYRDPVTGNLIEFIPANVYDGVLAERDPGYVKRLENLPETERQAYLFGNWDIFEGQFFSDFGEHNRETPFIIPEQDDNSRLIGSLDHGLAHYTSFGLAYLAPDGSIHRIFTYKANSGTTKGHAEAIAEAIGACRLTRYMFPKKIYYDYAMEAKKTHGEEVYCDLDEYIEVFSNIEAAKNTEFLPANKRKADGCHAMRLVFNGTNGTPIFRYFDGLNSELVEGLTDVLTDKINTEQYAKMDGDDCADDCRYMIMGALVDLQTLNLAAKKNEKTAKAWKKPEPLTKTYGLS